MTEDAAPGRFDEKRLEKLIDEAIVDCYDESEQATGLFVAIEQNVRVPFIALDGNERVTVTGFDQDELLVTAICECDGGQDDIPLIDLTLTTPLPEGGGVDRRILPLGPACGCGLR